MRRSILIYALLIILLGIATFFDLTIDRFLYHPQSGFGWFMEHIYILFMIGILPVTFVMQMSVKPNLITVLLGVASVFYMAREILYYLTPAYERYQQFMIAAILLVGLMIVMKLLPITLRIKLLPFLLYMCIVLITASLLVGILKHVWGRVRFRSPDGPQLFTPWYLPQGFNGNQSFPSGHTTAAGITLCLTALPQFYQKPIPSWVNAAAYLSPIMMAWSRMIMGAHYLSDTVFGFFIVYTIARLLILIRKKRQLIG